MAVSSAGWPGGYGSVNRVAMAATCTVPVQPAADPCGGHWAGTGKTEWARTPDNPASADGSDRRYPPIREICRKKSTTTPRVADEPRRLLWRL